MLGVGTYRAFIQPRGGARRLTELPWSSLRFGRRLDEVSDASVTVPTPWRNTECCGVLGSLNAFEHELAIWRDGLEAWVGPVTEPQYGGGVVVVPARDLVEWFERRTLPFTRTFTHDDLGDIYEQLAIDALSRDTSPNITIEPSPTGIFGDRSYEASAHTRANDAMRELARTGVDFTAKGRTILVGGEEVPTDPIGILTTEHFVESPKLRVRGLSAASEVAVIGGRGSGSTPPVGVAGGVGDAIGLVQVVFQESDIGDEESAEAAAVSRLAMLADPPEYLSGMLSPLAPFDFDELVPGAHVDVRVQVECRTVMDTMRLHSVEAGSSIGADGKRNSGVAIVLIPLGSEGEG